MISIPSVKGDTEDTLIIAGLDDVLCTGTTYSYTNTEVRFGRAASAADYNSSLRFVDINIPQGSRITNASLEVIAAATTSQTFSAVLSGEYVDNSDVYPTLDVLCALYYLRSYTPVTVSWSVTAFTSGSKYYSPNIAMIIENITNRTGWVSGNNISIKLHNLDGTTSEFHRFASEEHATNRAIALNITYTPPATNDCSCPSINTDWLINDGSVCNLTTTCNLGTGKIRVELGTLNINTGGSLTCSGGSLNRANNAKLTTILGGIKIDT